MPFYWRRGADDNLVVSMTSYPARIKGAWVSLESLFRQDYRRFVLVLVLAESQFPRRRLPLLIRIQVLKGLRILWVKEDNKSWDHLWPAYSSYPQSAIVSVDDDKVFPAHLVRNLVEASLLNQGAIVGARGWAIKLKDNEIRFGDGWVRATPNTASDALFMPPGNGSLYPVDSLPMEAGDTELMRKICPNADDVWYWAMGRLNGTRSICLGMRAHRLSPVQAKTPALADNDPGPQEFEAVLKWFGLSDLQLSNLVADSDIPIE